MNKEFLANKTLLLIDDEPDLLEALVSCFHNECKSLKIIQASSGNEAIKILNENSEVDLIVSDMRMPNGSGLDVLRSIKDQGKKIRTIICTGFSDVNDQELYLLGAHSIFKKPFSFKELVQEFRKIEL